MSIWMTIGVGLAGSFVGGLIVYAIGGEDAARLELRRRAARLRRDHPAAAPVARRPRRRAGRSVRDALSASNTTSHGGRPRPPREREDLAADAAAGDERGGDAADAARRARGRAAARRRPSCAPSRAGWPGRRSGSGRRARSRRAPGRRAGASRGGPVLERAPTQTASARRARPTRRRPASGWWAGSITRTCSVSSGSRARSGQTGRGTPSYSSPTTTSRCPRRRSPHGLLDLDLGRLDADVGVVGGEPGDRRARRAAGTPSGTPRSGRCRPGGPATSAASVGLRGLHAVEQRAGVLDEQPPGVGEPERAAGALEQRRAGLALEHGQLLGDRAGRVVERAGGGVDGSAGVELAQQAEAAQVEHPCRNATRSCAGTCACHERRLRARSTVCVRRARSSASCRLRPSAPWRSSASTPSTPGSRSATSCSSASRWPPRC